MVKSKETKKVMFLIPSLERGGAERQLVELAKRIDKKRFAITVTTFYDGGAFRSALENVAGVTIISLKKGGRWDVLPFLMRFWRAASKAQPQIMVGYLSLPSLLCLVVGRAIRAKVIWSLRASNVNYDWYSWGMHFSFRVGALLSRFADLIIVNSNAGKQYHLISGYDDSRMQVIPNGIDTQYYRPMPEDGQRLRAQWGIASSELVIGLVGRLDAMKDHPTFLRAAAQLAPEFRNVRFVCVGSGPRSYALQLQTLGASLGLDQKLIWVDAQNDMPAVYSAFDLLTSSSYGEGFSNVIAEAMACGVPCIVTGVGDSASIVGETGIVVPAQNPAALAAAWRSWIRMSADERKARSVQTRALIEREFNLQTMVARTEIALQGVMESACTI